MFLSGDRQSAIEIVLECNVLPDTYDLEKIKKGLDEWEVLNVVRKNKTIGMCMIKDKEIHFCILPEYRGRWLTKGLLKEISLLDFDCTVVPTDNLDEQDFVERIGFKPIQIINSNIIYQLDELKHG